MDVERSVRMAKGGDRQSLEDLCRYFHPQLYRFFLRLSGNQQDADDLSQSALLRMMERLDTFRFLPGRRFEGWLFRIAYHLFIDEKRRPPALPMSDEIPLPDPSPGAEEKLILRESAREVRAAVAALDEEMQALISMRYELDMPYRAIAQALSITETRVKWRLHEALTRLRTIMEEGGEQP